ncbi:hypothetical protein SODALDRAFT_362333 [Sodiomyces alkalinus F11]|uniref:Uncharacterized protein n=1 Tax=Sodiomyces alkalinus (strain CBS 110278 / VKM F-3762 / F11) TaxID=1314773 RepID=A0A3N2PPT3_SODAK|nr:hypothetical protein SODALDRAFT_362333 [Sodiomyces alkalinus F11]ROT36523.1 hypothetical protein SODALDRAFT_362333 [Sodiomyces alkalinus F11]
MPRRPAAKASRAPLAGPKQRLLRARAHSSKLEEVVGTSHFRGRFPLPLLSDPTPSRHNRWFSHEKRRDPFRSEMDVGDRQSHTLRKRERNDDISYLGRHPGDLSNNIRALLFSSSLIYHTIRAFSPSHQLQASQSSRATALQGINKQQQTAPMKRAYLTHTQLPHISLIGCNYQVIASYHTSSDFHSKTWGRPADGRCTFKTVTYQEKNRAAIRLQYVYQPPLPHCASICGALGDKLQIASIFSQDPLLEEKRDDLMMWSSASSGGGRIAGVWEVQGFTTQDSGLRIRLPAGQITITINYETNKSGVRTPSGTWTFPANPQLTTLHYTYSICTPSCCLPHVPIHDLFINVGPFIQRHVTDSAQPPPLILSSPLSRVYRAPPVNDRANVIDDYSGIP